MFQTKPFSQDSADRDDDYESINKNTPSCKPRTPLPQSTNTQLDHEADNDGCNYSEIVDSSPSSQIKLKTPPPIILWNRSIANVSEDGYVVPNVVDTSCTAAVDEQVAAKSSAVRSQTVNKLNKPTASSHEMGSSFKSKPPAPKPRRAAPSITPVNNVAATSTSSNGIPHVRHRRMRVPRLRCADIT